MDQERFLLTIEHLERINGPWTISELANKTDQDYSVVRKRVNRLLANDLVIRNSVRAHTRTDSTKYLYRLVRVQGARLDKPLNAV